EERGVVGGAVILARASAAIVAATGLDTLGVEFLDRVMVFRAEGDVRTACLLAVVQMQPQRGCALWAEAGAAVVARAQHEAERGGRCRIEAHRAIEVANA